MNVFIKKISFLVIFVGGYAMLDAEQAKNLKRTASFRHRNRVQKEYTALDQPQKRNPEGDFTVMSFANEKLGSLDGLNDLDFPKDKVEKLYLNNNDLTEITNPQDFKGFVNLQELHLENNEKLTNIAEGVFSEVDRVGLTINLFNTAIRSGTALRLKQEYPGINFIFPDSIARTVARVA